MYAPISYMYENHGKEEYDPKYNFMSYKGLNPINIRMSTPIHINTLKEFSLPLDIIPLMMGL